MARFSLKMDPTFKAKVGLYVPGKGEEKVEFEFKGRTRTELAALSKEMADAAENAPDLSGMSAEEATQISIEREAGMLMAIAVGWELDDDFNEENVKRLLQKCPMATDAVMKRYLQEVSQAKLGN